MKHYDSRAGCDRVEHPTMELGMVPDVVQMKVGLVQMAMERLVGAE